MVKILSVGRFLTWQSSMKPLFRRDTTILLSDERLMFSFFARGPSCGATSKVVLSILLSRSHITCSGSSAGNFGGLPLGRPVALCFMAQILAELPRDGASQSNNSPNPRHFGKEPPGRRLPIIVATSATAWRGFLAWRAAILAAGG